MTFSDLRSDVLAAQEAGAPLQPRLLHLPRQVEQLAVHGQPQVRGVLPALLPARGLGDSCAAQRRHLQRVRAAGQEVQEAAGGDAAALGTRRGRQVSVQCLLQQSTIFRESFRKTALK